MVTIMDEILQTSENQEEAPTGSSTNCDNLTVISIPLNDDTSSTYTTDSSQHLTELNIIPNNNQLLKKSLKLDLDLTCLNVMTEEIDSISSTGSDRQHDEEDDPPIKSPKSQTGRVPHQSSITEPNLVVVDDRKALRDVLYQGIFHRHRRTIFAVGSFLRMLKSRNSQYNTIRSSSEGEEDTR